MAEVKNIQLTVGRAPSGRDFAEVSYDIEFTQTERDLNVHFFEFVLLFERDDDLDRYFEAVNNPDQIELLRRGNTDDFIGQVGSGLIVPGDNTTLHRNVRREWRFPNNESGNEEYRALVQVVPQIRRGAGWSNEVKANLR